MERKEYNVVVKIIGGQSPCKQGHRIGDEWIIKGKTPDGLCTVAFNTIYQMIWGLQYGAVYPWQEDPDIMRITCPDPDVNMVFELRRISRE